MKKQKENVSEGNPEAAVQQNSQKPLSHDTEVDSKRLWIMVAVVMGIIILFKSLGF